MCYGPGFKMLLLLGLMIAAGITAGEGPEPHYRKRGSSFCLQAGKSHSYKNIEFSVEQQVIFMGKEITPNFSGKVDYDPGSNTLCIKNLTEEDNGVYEVLTVDSHFKRSITSHRLIVQEPVPKPVISVSVMGSNFSTGFCNMSVKCSVLDEWLLAVCDVDSCRTTRASLSKFNITLSTNKTSILCSGLNQVSSNSASEKMDTACYSKRSNGHKETSQSSNMIVYGIAVAVVVILIVFTAIVLQGLNSSKCYRHQPPSAQLINSQPTEPEPQPVTRNLSSSSDHPDAAYENVDPTGCSQISGSARDQEGESGPKESQTVDTVYSVLQLPRVVVENSDKGDNKEVEIEQETTTETSVNLREGAPMQVDTVYSMVKEPWT